MIGPEVVTQIVTIVTAVWYTSRGVIKRIKKVEEKVDALPCNNGGCNQKRPKFIILKTSAEDVK